MFGLPTASDDLLGSEKWSAGPTGVALWQGHGWTVGALANHLWSFAGDDDQPAVNATFIQPFISYTTHDAWSFTLNTEFDVQLGGRGVVGTNQLHCRQDRKVRQVAGTVVRSGALLG